MARLRLQRRPPELYRRSSAEPRRCQGSRLHQTPSRHRRRPRSSHRGRLSRRPRLCRHPQPSRRNRRLHLQPEEEEEADATSRKRSIVSADPANARRNGGCGASLRRTPRCRSRSRDCSARGGCTGRRCAAVYRPRTAGVTALPPRLHTHCQITCARQHRAALAPGVLGRVESANGDRDLDRIAFLAGDRAAGGRWALTIGWDSAWILSGRYGP